MLRKKISAKQITFKILCGFSFLLVFFVLLYPLCTVAVKAFTEKTSLNPNAGAFINSRLFRIACFTVYQAFTSACFATLLGFALAYFCAKKEFALRSFLLALAAVPVAVPPLIMALSYVFFFGKAGIINSLLSLFIPKLNINERNFLYSFFAVILIHSFYNFPIALKTISTVWENLDSDLENAAKLLCNNRLRIFFKIILPELFPAILSSFLLIFIYCFFSFMIILLFGGLALSTLEVELYQVSRFSVRIIDSAKIAFLETAIAFTFVLVYIFTKCKAYKNAVENRKIKIRDKMTKAEKMIFIALFALSLIFLILPLLSIFLKSIFSFSVKNTDSTFFERLKSFFMLDVSSWNILFSRSTIHAILSTLIVGFFTASTSVLVALCLSYFEFKSLLKNKTNFILKILAFLPLIISPVVLAFALRRTFHLSGRFSILLLSIAQSCRAWTIAYTQINASFLQIPKSVLQASILLSDNYFDAFYRAVLPLVKTGALSGFAFCFAISAGDASLPLTLHIAGFQNLSLMILRLSASYRFAESSVLAFVLILIVFLNFFIITKVKDRKNIQL